MYAKIKSRPEIAEIAGTNLKSTRKIKRWRNWHPARPWPLWPRRISGRENYKD